MEIVPRRWHISTWIILMEGQRRMGVRRGGFGKGNKGKPPLTSPPDFVVLSAHGEGGVGAALTRLKAEGERPRGWEVWVREAVCPPGTSPHPRRARPTRWGIKAVSTGFIGKGTEHTGVVGADPALLNTKGEH